MVPIPDGPVPGGCRETLSARELALTCGLHERELSELVEYGALMPDIPAASHWTFNGRYARTLLRASRLRDDLLLDFDSFALAVGLIAEIVALEDELQLCTTGVTVPHLVPK